METLTEAYFDGHRPYREILAAIDRLQQAHAQVRVAIDGPCASGKSTLGRALARGCRCPLIHMDDFYLRPEQRTPERLAEPGGNVDYERFDREILSPLCRGEAAQYRPWLCREAVFGPEITVAPTPLAVVEGSYSLRPELRDRYHLRIWVEAPWEVRRARLLKRGGPDCLARFEQIWVPLEDRYFAVCRVKECCHIHYIGE